MNQAALIFFVVAMLKGYHAAPPSEDSLRATAQKILSEVATLKQNVADVRAEAENVVHRLLLATPEGKALERQFVKGIKTGKLDANCSAEIDYSLSIVVQNVAQYILHLAAKNLTGTDNFFGKTLETLETIEHDLTVNLDKEIHDCVIGSGCKITNDYIQETEKLFKLSDTGKTALLDKVKRISNSIVPEQAKSMEEFIDNSDDGCLKKLQTV